MSGWPEGWSLERVRADPWAGVVEEVPCDGVYVVIQMGLAAGPNDYLEVTPQLVLLFGDYALVRPEGEDVWLMGLYNPDDQSVACWGEVGTDLGAAIRGL